MKSKWKAHFTDQIIYCHEIRKIFCLEGSETPYYTIQFPAHVFINTKMKIICKNRLLIKSLYCTVDIKMSHLQMFTSANATFIRRPSLTIKIPVVYTGVWVCMWKERLTEKNIIKTTIMVTFWEGYINALIQNICGSTAVFKLIRNFHIRFHNASQTSR